MNTPTSRLLFDSDRPVAVPEGNARLIPWIEALTSATLAVDALGATAPSGASVGEKTMNKPEKNERNKPKLVLRKESIRTIDAKDLARVVGGGGGGESPPHGGPPEAKKE